MKQSFVGYILLLSFLFLGRNELFTQEDDWADIKTMTIVPFHLDAERRGIYQPETIRLRRGRSSSIPFASTGNWVTLDTVPDTTAGFVYFIFEHRRKEDKTMVRVCRNSSLAWQKIEPDSSTWFKPSDLGEWKTFFSFIYPLKWFNSRCSECPISLPYNALAEPSLVRNYEDQFPKPFIPIGTFEQDTLTQKTILAKALNYLGIELYRYHFYPELRELIAAEIRTMARQFAEADMDFELIEPGGTPQSGTIPIRYDPIDIYPIYCDYSAYANRDLTTSSEVAEIFNSCMEEFIEE